jgi:hypothetical protein
MGRSRNSSGYQKSSSSIKINKHNYLSAISRSVVDLESDEEEETKAVVKCTNRTATFAPPYWCFVFSDMSLREYVCITVNIPCGLCRDETVDVQVLPCRTKLLVASE